MSNYMKNGFTLIELLLVVSIVLTLGVLSTSFYSRFLVQNSVSNSTNLLVGQLRKAQTYAMMGKQNSAWGVRFSSQTVTLFATVSAQLDERFSVNPNISVSGLTTITFEKMTGLPNSTPTIVVTGNSDTKTIIVNSQGVVSK